MIKLVIADMDGTLLNSKKELSKRLFDVIEQLKKQNVRFAVASGRQYYNLLKVFEEIKEDVLFICENGTIVFDQGVNIYTDEIDYEELAPHVERIRNMEGAYPILCGTHSAYIENDDEEFLNNARMYYEHCELVPDILEAAKNDKICKIAIFDKINAETNTYEIYKKYSEQYTVTLSGERWVDVMNLGANKGHAIEMIQKQYNIEKKECMAFGDYLNDYEMMKVCDYSYAMANAHPLLKEVSNYEAKSNDEDGVVDTLIRHFHLN